MQFPQNPALTREDHRFIAAHALKERLLLALKKQLHRGSLAKASVISSFLVIGGLFLLLRVLAWLLPTRVHLNFHPTVGNVAFLFLLAIVFTFPVMWIVRTFYRDDIAELERRVAERTAQLRTANRELEAFSYTVSHDLRAPLRHINAFSQLLATKLNSETPPDAQQYLERILDASNKMEALIDDLLKLAHLGRQEVVHRRVDVNAVVARVISELQPECDGRKIEWQVGDLPTLHCDHGLVKVVFTNLLSNAIKYTRRTERAVIEIGQTIERGVPVIFIRDNGAGFDQSYAHKLFGPFQRLHRSDEFEGTGVGLATVRRIIEKHGGGIWAEGRVNEGATFRFTLGSTLPNGKE